MTVFVTNSFPVTAVQKLLKLVLSLAEVIDRSLASRFYGPHVYTTLTTGPN